MAIKIIKSILYASDLMGYDGRDAFRVAAGHSIVNDAKLIFLNVIEPLNPMAEKAVSLCLTEKELNEIRTDGYDQVQNDIAERIHNFVKDELENGVKLPFAPEVCIEQGMPAEIILKMAKDKNADMIVMGTRTHSKLSQILVGSTAHQVLFHANCPVLIIPIGQ